MSKEKPEDMLVDIYAQYRKSVLLLLQKLEDIDGKRSINSQNEMRAMVDHISRCFMDGIEECDVVEELHGARSHMKRLTLDCYKELEVYYYDVAKKFYEEPPEETEKYLEADEGFCTTFVKLDGGNFWQKFCKHREGAIEETRLAKEAETISTEEAYKHYEKMVDEYLSLEKLLDDYHDGLVDCRMAESVMRKKQLKEQKWLARVQNKWSTIIGGVICTAILQLFSYFFGCSIWDIFK